MDVYWNKLAHDRLWYFIRQINTEIGGFGYAERLHNDADNSDDLLVHDVFLVPQYVTGAEVDFIDGSGVGAAVERAAEDGWLSNPKFVWVSWHSHNSMKAFWSGTDEKCITAYGEQGISTLLSVVGNHSGEYQMRFDLFDPSVYGFSFGRITFDKLKMLKNSLDEAWDWDSEWKAEMDAALRKKPKAQPKNDNVTTTNTHTGYTRKGDVEESNGKEKHIASRHKDGITFLFYPSLGWAPPDDKCDDQAVWAISEELDAETLELGGVIVSKLVEDVVKMDDLTDYEFYASEMFLTCNSTTISEIRDAIAIAQGVH